MLMVPEEVRAESPRNRGVYFPSIEAVERSDGGGRLGVRVAEDFDADSERFQPE